MDYIKIPKRFEQKLEKDPDYNSIVNEIIRRFSPIIKENKLEFFPEYTDHGFLHINKTLEIANRIIPSKTFDKLNTLDISMIILSIFLHDLGMHITYEFFIELIRGESKKTIDIRVDKKTWDILWDEYFSEAKLWSVKKLKAIFNDEFEIKQPPTKRGDATENDKKFIGEFLRRNHPRLAYEICVFGFLEVNGERMEFSKNLDNKLKMLLGFIARSHGMNLWDVFQYIEDEFGRAQIRAPKNVHAIYIMVILRMADYLDIDKSRANTPILKFKKINSIISELEWKKHNAIDYVAMEYQDDPESIYVYVNEITQSKIYLSIRDLLKNMQNELDTCWAVLGKVYGAYENLKLSFRRIHSNIDNKEVFLKYINFIPERVKFDSNPDILKLLIEPLYGKNPAYGIRELLQNSIDACIEKERVYCDKYEPKVIITISDDQEYIIVEDNGIGMNKDILINYFLVAGASFRNSDVWKKTYCSNNKSIIPRSGRFGVGVFASFLLGNEILVETSRMGEEIEYKFEANIDTDQIEVLKTIVDSNKSGTKIKIKLDKTVIEQLKEQYENTVRGVKWNCWYFAEKPKLIINVPPLWRKYSINDGIIVSLYNENIESYWKSIRPDGYYRVDWTYKIYNKLICNGIIIPNDYSAYTFKRYRFPSNFLLPTVSIVDSDANLPLNLDRNGISSNKIPFETELVKDIYTDIIANLLTMENISELNTQQLIIKETKFLHPAIRKREYKYHSLESEDLILTKKGFNLCHYYNLERLDIKLINKMWVNSDTYEINDKELISKIDQLIVSKENISSIQDFKQCIDCNFQVNLGRDYDLTNIRAFIKKEDFNYIFAKGKNRMRGGFEANIHIESESDNWYCIVYGDVPDSKLNIEYFERNSSDINLYVEYYYTISQYYQSYYNETTIFEDIMAKYFGEDIYIPYDINIRIDKFNTVLKEFKKYLPTK
ncbi:ATP-binding protein [Clostridium perfringens]|uniref:ATPase domain protein n=2 Tax=Clostridium perfringens TaxID=1502 RepID=A0A0H2YNW7_CLOP1|nr:ATP-binding protein [Clostridium perfringens]ABG82602.1 ATPase domain protein [Clostridium perfringens ATCC 13124]MDM0604515.1 ATP-binding protein [Clostridium perfringens]